MQWNCEKLSNIWRILPNIFQGLRILIVSKSSIPKTCMKHIRCEVKLHVNRRRGTWISRAVPVSAACGGRPGSERLVERRASLWQRFQEWIENMNWMYLKNEECTSIRLLKCQGIFIFSPKFGKKLNNKFCKSPCCFPFSEHICEFPIKCHQHCVHKVEQRQIVLKNMMFRNFLLK